MLIEYTLKIESSHSKYLKWMLLNILLKLKNFNINKFGFKNSKNTTKKLTVLKSPFINKTARDQYKLVTIDKYCFFSIILKKNNIWLQKVFENILKNELSLSFGKISLTKKIMN